MQTIVGLPAYYACIALETTGITHFTWLLADLSCKAAGLEETHVFPDVKHNEHDPHREHHHHDHRSRWFETP